jgi:hypothetical protein
LELLEGRQIGSWVERFIKYQENEQNPAKVVTLFVQNLVENVDEDDGNAELEAGFAELAEMNTIPPKSLLSLFKLLLKMLSKTTEMRNSKWDLRNWRK